MNELWTVIGFFPETEEVLSCPVEAPMSIGAAAIVADRFVDTSLIIIGVVPGDQELEAFDGDAGHAVHASELIFN